MANQVYNPRNTGSFSVYYTDDRFVVTIENHLLVSEVIPPQVAYYHQSM